MYAISYLLSVKEQKIYTYFSGKGNSVFIQYALNSLNYGKSSPQLCKVVSKNSNISTLTDQITKICINHNEAIRYLSC